jgi:hypothetical protein
MNQGTRWVLLMQKNRQRKSHAWAPLNGTSPLEMMMRSAAWRTPKKPVLWIRIWLVPNSIRAWIRDPDPYSEPGAGFRIQMSKNRFKKAKFTMTDFQDEKQKNAPIELKF